MRCAANWHMCADYLWDAHRGVTPPHKHTRRHTFKMTYALMVQAPISACRLCVRDNWCAWYLQTHLLGLVRVHDTMCTNNVRRAHPESDAILLHDMIARSWNMAGT